MAVLRVGVGGAADQVDAGRVGVGRVEREAGHVVVVVFEGGSRGGEREAGGRQRQRRLRVGAVAEEERRRCEVRRVGDGSVGSAGF